MPGDVDDVARSPGVKTEVGSLELVVVLPLRERVAEAGAAGTAEEEDDEVLSADEAVD